MLPGIAASLNGLRVLTDTTWAKSLSGEQMTTWSTPASLRKHVAAAASASSASNATMGQTTTPKAATASSASRNWANRSDATPVLVSYPAKRSLRKDAMMCSKRESHNQVRQWGLLDSSPIPEGVPPVGLGSPLSDGSPARP